MSTDIKDAQMLLVRGLKLEQAQEVLLTLVWKSDPALVTQVLVERGIIDPVDFWASILKKEVNDASVK